MILFAAFTRVFRSLTLSSMATPALLLIFPSIRSIDLPMSGEYPGWTIAVATLLPSISTTSPGISPSVRIVSVSSRAIPLPASLWYASATRNITDASPSSLSVITLSSSTYLLFHHYKTKPKLLSDFYMLIIKVENIAK